MVNDMVQQSRKKRENIGNFCTYWKKNKDPIMRKKWDQSTVKKRNIIIKIKKTTLYDEDKPLLLDVEG